MTPPPALFLAHGAPDLPLTDHVAKRFLTGLAAQLPRPKAIVIVSAHWEARVPTIGAAAQPKTIHDFGGFDPTLRRIAYPARTDAAIVDRTADLLAAAGLPVERDPSRGYDHGVWTPLILSYPKADIPVVQLSLERGGDAARHFAIGRALAPLREDGVLVIGSGGVVHNLAALAPEGAPPPLWAVAFDAWVADAIASGRGDALLGFPDAPADARQAHPTPEHFLPLLVAFGAGGNGAQGHRIHHSFSYDSISTTSYAFGRSYERVRR